MTTLQLIAGSVAGVISVVAFAPYILSAVRHQTRPSTATWCIWTVVGGILGAGTWTSGARASLGVAAAYIVCPLVTTIVAYRYGERSFSRFDKGCFVATAMSLALWVLSGNPLLAMALCLLIDLLGALPTIQKVWATPESEDKLSWSLFTLANALNLAAIESWTLTAALYPVYLFWICFLVTVLVSRRKRGSLAVRNEPIGAA